MKERVFGAAFALAVCALLVAASLNWSAAQPLCNKTTKDYRIFFECNGCGYVNLLVENGLCHTLTTGMCVATNAGSFGTSLKADAA